MKSPLRYQATDADCGKTSFVNAFMYLFERSEIPPQAVDFVTRVTGDCNLAVNGYYRGTSAHALAFMAAWCNDYLVKAGMPVRCQALRDDEVSMAEGSPLVEGLRSGAVAVCGCHLRGPLRADDGGGRRERLPLRPLLRAVSARELCPPAQGCDLGG